MKKIFIVITLSSLFACNQTGELPDAMPDQSEVVAEIDYTDDGVDDNTDPEDNLVEKAAGARPEATTPSQSIYFTVNDSEELTTFTLTGYYFGTTAPAGQGTESELASVPVKNVKALKFLTGSSMIKSKALKEGYWVIKSDEVGKLLIQVVKGKKGYANFNIGTGNEYYDDAGHMVVTITGKSLSKTEEYDVNANSTQIPIERTVSTSDVVKLYGHRLVPVGNYVVKLAHVTAGSGAVTEKILSANSAVISGKGTAIKVKYP